MSIDGVEIVDSDLAHDIYNEILDLYDAGCDRRQIEERLPTYQECVFDECDRDIYLTAKAKAYWEMGFLTSDLVDAVASAIGDEKGLLIWKSDGGEDAYHARKRVLERFLKQIAVPKRHPRPRKKYATVKKKLFGVGDCVLLANGDEIHKGVVCQIVEYRGECTYAMLVMEPGTMPGVQSFIEGNFVGRRIPSTIDRRGFTFGPMVVMPEHRMILKEDISFDVIGSIELDQSLYCLGSCTGVLSKNDVLEEFIRIPRDMDVFGEKLIPLKELMKAPS